MKVLVLKRFRDKYDKKTRYQPGEVVEFEEERAKDLIERGLGAWGYGGPEDVFKAVAFFSDPAADDGKADDVATATDAGSADMAGDAASADEPKPEAEPEAKVESEPEPETKPKAKSKPKAKEK